MNAAQCISDFFRLVVLLLLTFVTVCLTTRVGLSGNVPLAGGFVTMQLKIPRRNHFPGSSVLQFFSKYPAMGVTL